MSIKWSDTKMIEIQGLNYVNRIVNDAGCIFNKIDGTNDIGLDGYMEIIQDNSPTGLCIGIQVKAGNSNITGKKERIIVKADQNHFEYWYNHILPVIAIVYIPSWETAYWADITQYLADNEDLIEKGPYTIEVSSDRVFDKDNFKLFHYHLLKYLSSYGDDKFFGRSLKLLADPDNVKNRYEAVKSLFSFHRNKLEAWHYLVTRFCFEQNEIVQIALIYAYRHLLKHGDIWWHPGNVIESTISKDAKQLLVDYFGYEEVSKLLNNIEDEGGISRGTVGYDVNFIIRLIPDRIDHLKKIILKNDTNDEKRFWAAICLINEFQYYDLERAINFTDSMRANFPDSTYNERFMDIKQGLLDCSEIDFCG